jgi:hypothetical protein
VKHEQQAGRKDRPSQLCLNYFILLHVSALLESHHQARKKYTKNDNLNKTH